MLSRSHFSIRRLMPQRRQNSDDDLFWDNDEKASLKVTDGRGSPSPSLETEDRKRRNSRPWMSKGSTKKIPQPIIVVRSSEDLHRITHLPPLPDTPHSSKSSLCSCEQHAAGYASPRPLPRGASPGPSPGRGSMRSKTHSERRISPPPGSPLENPRPSPKLPTDARTKNKSVKSLPSPTKLTFDLLEALEIQPDNAEMATPMPILPPTPPRRRSTPIPERDLDSENVNQFIQQPDKTSDSVDAEISTEEKPELDGRVSHEETKAASPPTRPAPPPPVRRKPVPLRHTVTKRVSKPALSPLKSPTRSASVSKAKRQKSQKSRNGRPPRPVAKKQRSKWSVNAKDLLIVRLFNRLEVDEVLSPTRLQEIRMSGQILSRRSSETLRTIQSDGSDTPVDPFNLQDLPTRIGAAGVRLSIPSPIVEVPTPRTFDFNIVAERRRSSVKSQDTITTAEQSSSPPSEANPSQPPSEEDTMAPRDAYFPALPARNPSRLAPSSRKDLPHLPSIPEVMVTTPENFTLTSTFSTQPPRRIPIPQEDSPYIHLPSTPYTLTVPAFRHGPIRLAKADIALSSHSSKLATAAVDDSLDWTAFHMAILGGAGDSVFGESTDYSRRADGMEEDELDEICEWFAGFGFSGYGKLDSGVARQSVSSYSPPMTVDGHSPTSSARSSRSGKHLPIPVEQEFPTGFWNQQQPGQDSGSRFDRARSAGLRRWTPEGHPKRYEGGNVGMMRVDSARRPSVDSLASLPQSPMLDLRTSRDVVGNEYTVPMGYNLSHDARDFLSWGAENVCAEAFAGGQGEEQGKAELEG